MKQEIQGVSILMPCLNEEKTVGACVKSAKRFLAENGLAGEVLVADNGSSDHSAEVASAAGARVVSVPEKGYGAAILGGIKAAKYPFIIMADSDESYNFLEIMPFYEKLADGAELVIGNRFLGGIEQGAMPVLHRYVGNPLLSWAGRVKCGAPVSDFHCGLRAFQKDAILSVGLCTTQMEFASEMIVKAVKNGLKVEELPCRLYKDKRGRASHLRSLRDGFRHLFFLLQPTWFEK